MKGKGNKELVAINNDSKVIGGFIPVTLQAKTKVTGLASGTRIYFRFRAILKDGAASWSAFVSIIVL